jgi:hypothetical protein
VSIEHLPTARSSAECPACQGGAAGFDHEAVYRARPKDFDAQVARMVEEVARGARMMAGVTLHPNATRQAQRWLREHR